MKQAILTALFAISLTACGGSQANVNLRSPAKPAPTAAAIATPIPAETQPAVNGEKVERTVTVRFPSKGTNWPDGWTWVDPDSGTSPTPYEFKDGRLKMTISPVKDLYANNRNAPRLLKAIKGDFQIETRVKFDPKQDYQGAGIVIYVDGGNYLRFERSFGGIGDGGSGIRLDARRRDNHEPITTPGEIPTDAGEVELKLIRRANVFSAFWRQDESSEWREVEDVTTDFPETVQAGVIACSTAEEITAEFAYIRLLPQLFPANR